MTEEIKNLGLRRIDMIDLLYAINEGIRATAFRITEYPSEISGKYDFDGIDNYKRLDNLRALRKLIEAMK